MDSIKRQLAGSSVRCVLPRRANSADGDRHTLNKDISPNHIELRTPGSSEQGENDSEKCVSVLIWALRAQQSSLCCVLLYFWVA